MLLGQKLRRLLVSANALADTTRFMAKQAWTVFLEIPGGELVYVLLTILGPTMLGVPGLVPQGHAWVILALIGLASCYGVSKKRLDEEKRNAELTASIIEGISRGNQVREREISISKKEIAALEEIARTQQNRISALGGKEVL